MSPKGSIKSVIVFNPQDTYGNLRRRLRRYISAQIKCIKGTYPNDVQVLCRIAGAIDFYTACGLFGTTPLTIA